MRNLIELFPNNHFDWLAVCEWMRSVDHDSSFHHFDEDIAELYPATQGFYISLDKIPKKFWEEIKSRSLGIAKGMTMDVRVYNSDWGYVLFPDLALFKKSDIDFLKEYAKTWADSNQDCVSCVSAQGNDSHVPSEWYESLGVVNFWTACR